MVEVHSSSLCNRTIPQRPTLVGLLPPQFASFYCVGSLALAVRGAFAGSRALRFGGQLCFFPVVHLYWLLDILVATLFGNVVPLFMRRAAC